ncbi:acyltransferase [Alteromonas sediminis]|uniref:Acyltransferase n=1 Tax=Alteromonas sediminis TaxID=2259342 RepID=A0A3N5Y9Q7_9ALTE|nr:acyltransferase [Alteromonas sediminis]RPJ65415.1 acyltransferase [Alteromonas sediminis]
MIEQGNASHSDESKHWSDIKEAGTLTGMQFLYFIYRVFGRWIFSLIMYPVALYFVLFRSEQRKASRQFLMAHYKKYPQMWTRKPNDFHVLLHFKSFAELILDKLLGWLIEIKESDFILTEPALIDDIMHDSRGQLIIGSHFGNLEFCRGFMQRYKDKVINVLLYDKHAGNFVKLMQRQNPDSRLNVFQVDEFDVATIMLLKEKLEAGEWVFIAGDRIPLTGIERSVYVDFFNEKAPFPIGPYMLAKAMGCPVKLMFAYRDQSTSNKVVFDVRPLCEKLVLSRKNKMQEIQQYAQNFASALEEHSAKAPYQWFNFYDFWHAEASVPVPTQK